MQGPGLKATCHLSEIPGENVDQRSDIFSAGILGYQLFSGKHPFNHASGAFSIFELIREKSFNCSEIPANSSLPEAVRKAVMKMLTKDKSLRYHSIYEPLGELARENTQLCPLCSSSNPVANNFCGQCGSRLGSTTRSASEEQQTRKQERSATRLTDEGFELTKQDDWEGAIKKYREALQIDSSFARAFANLGYALNRLGKYSEAIEVLSRGLEVTTDPNSRHRLFDNRGFAKSNLKDYSGAIDDFTEAIELNDHNPRVLSRGVVCSKWGR